jgi:hypothetical protein
MKDGPRPRRPSRRPFRASWSAPGRRAFESATGYHKPLAGCQRATLIPVKQREKEDAAMELARGVFTSKLSTDQREPDPDVGGQAHNSMYGR